MTSSAARLLHMVALEGQEAQRISSLFTFSSSHRDSLFPGLNSQCVWHMAMVLSPTCKLILEALIKSTCSRHSSRRAHGQEMRQERI